MTKTNTERTCGCGAPVAIQKTGECMRCYTQRWQRERRASAIATPCPCGLPAVYASSGECRDCHRTRLRLAHHDQARSAGMCITCAEAPVYVLTTRQCRWCHATSKPLSVSYYNCHNRVRSWRGPASRQTCPCGAPAAEWAYRGAAATQRVSGVVTRNGKRVHMSWSPNPTDYDALCQRCHGERDRPDYGKGYRHDEPTRLAKGRKWRSESYARQVSTEEGRAAYRARKQAEKQRRAARQSKAGA